MKNGERNACACDNFVVEENRGGGGSARRNEGVRPIFQVGEHTTSTRILIPANNVNRVSPINIYGQFETRKISQNFDGNVLRVSYLFKL